MSERKRYSHEGQGRVLTLEDGMTVVPYQQTRGGWYCVVVDPGSDPKLQFSYPRGGYNIVVADRDVEAAEERTLIEMTQGRASEHEYILPPADLCPTCRETLPCLTCGAGL